MAKKWSLQNAVNKFKPNLKNTLKKNKGNLNVYSFESLIKEMKCYYKVVDVIEGKGRDRIIYTDKKRNEKVKKEDRRQFNKGAAQSHSKHLALIVMSKMDDMDDMARTLNAWATYFGLISPAERDIMNSIYSEDALKPYKNSMINFGILEDGEEKIFQDLANTLRNVSKGQLQTVLNQAVGLKLINIISSWKGKVKNFTQPIDIEKSLAMGIKKKEDELLKKHGITKPYSLMFKNSPKTKIFKAEWLKYMDSLEDGEGNAMQLQYIYEVFQIRILNKNAFDEFIKAHYPSEIGLFDLLENEEAYNTKLLNYVVENAQKKHEKSLEFNNKNLTIDEGTKEVLAMFNITGDDAIAKIEEEKTQRENTPYEALLKSEKYVDCIRNLHILLHDMGNDELEKMLKIQEIKEEQVRAELEELGLSNTRRVEINNSVKDEVCKVFNVDTFELIEEETKLKEINQHLNKVSKAIIGKKVIDYEYRAAMDSIRDEIREYEEKYGADAMKRITYDSFIKELTKEVQAETSLAENKQKFQLEKERLRKEWEKLFEGGQLIKNKHTTKNPLETFINIRKSSFDKENS